MKIQDLGTLEGNVLLFGGPYSNLQATQALADKADRFAPGNVICTGDIVAYCGDPGPCVDLVRARGWPVVAGNCERQLAARAEHCGCGFDDGSACDLLSRGWFSHADAQIGDEVRNWMAELPDVVMFTHHGRRFAVIHGGLSNVARFLWPDTSDCDFAQEIALIRDQIGPVDVVIAGHCGIAFHRRIADVEWINAGVIGMPPHDGRAETRYGVLNELGVVFHRLSYDVAAAKGAMINAGLMQGYEQVLQTGCWPSEDVLPAALRR